MRSSSCPILNTHINKQEISNWWNGTKYIYRSTVLKYIVVLFVILYFISDTHTITCLYDMTQYLLMNFNTKVYKHVFVSGNCSPTDYQWYFCVFTRVLLHYCTFTSVKDLSS